MNLAVAFPNLSATTHRITSPVDPAYNCIAWAAGDDRRWWWPDAALIGYWPPDTERSDSLAGFRQAFESLGYHIVSDPETVPGSDVIAIFAKDGVPTHASRRLPNGLWSSKLGRGPDIEHELTGIEGDLYGSVAIYLSRRAA
jgi:hypothetical protein